MCICRKGCVALKITTYAKFLRLDPTHVTDLSKLLWVPFMGAFRSYAMVKELLRILSLGLLNF